MSVHISSMVYRARLGSAARKSVALKLADVADENGESIFPAVATIAREAEVSERTAQRVLKAFITEGLLVIVKRGGHGPRDTTEYRFDLAKLTALIENKGAKMTPEKRVTERHPSTPAKGDTVSAKGDTLSPKGCHGDTRPVTELPRTAAASACESAKDAKQNIENRFDDLVQACNGALDNPANCMALLTMVEPRMWVDAGCDVDLDVIPALKAAGKKYHGKRIRSWAYFNGMVMDAKARRERGLPPVEIKPAQSQTQTVHKVAPHVPRYARPAEENA